MESIAVGQAEPAKSLFTLDSPDNANYLVFEPTYSNGRGIMKRFVLTLSILVLYSITFAQGAVDFGLKFDLDSPFAGEWQSNEYSGNGFNGGWFDNSTYRTLEVLEMNTRWDITSEMRFGGGGFIGYWFSNSMGVRLDLDYFTGSIETKAVLDYQFYDSNLDEYHIVNVEYDPPEDNGSFSTFKIAPTLQFSFSDNPRSGLGFLLGPAIYIDNYEVFYVAPTVITDDDDIYYYDPVAGGIIYAYDENATAFGVTAGLTARYPVSPSVFLEGDITLDLGQMPAYSEIENYMFGEIPILSIEDKSSFLRSVGIQLAIGFNPSPVQYADSDSDGVWDPWDMCPNTPPGNVVNERGCPRRERRPLQDIRVEEEIVDKGVFVTNDILFEFNSDEITPDSYNLLDKIGEVLEKHPGWVIEIAGHTDSIGTESYNKKLSQRRAKAVKNYIAGNFDVIPANLTAQGYGESQPIADNGTEQGRAQNRRVEFRKIN